MMKLLAFQGRVSAKGRRRPTAVVAVVGTVLALSSVLAVHSAEDAAAAATSPGPIVPAPKDAVTADALPTVQIDGVAWTQVVVGNTVYVGGSFTTARPAGSAAGVNTTPRSNMLAYDITTGNLITSFAPNFNGQVRILKVSPDGTRLYAGGDFTTVDGKVHNRIAAFSTATGSLLSTFNGGVDAGVHALAVTNSTVYAGGLFAAANGNPRAHLAAFDTTGALTAWAPTTDDTVEGMIVSPDGTRVIVGGHFLNVNGTPTYGMGSVDASTGASLPWAVNKLLKDAGNNSAILSFTTDGTNIIGTGYSFSQGGNFEGTFAADPTTGNLVWMEDCHGDTYGAFVAHGLVYTISHAHFCGNDGGWPVYNPWQFRRTVAFTNSVTGSLAPNSMGNYTSFAGQPSPSIVNWFPDYTTGTFTGQGQAAWTVAGNADYVVEGGEFPTVNNTAQQGLVRFAVRGIAPAKQAPRISGARFVPTVNTFAPGTAHIAWQANWDRDDKTLTYKLVRDSDNAHPIWTGTQDSTWWDRPPMSFTDTGLVPGSTHKYRLYATDGDGNQVAGDGVMYTVPSTAASTGYDQQVVADGASTYWPLDEASGAIAYDNAGGNDADIYGTVTRGDAGPVAPETGTVFAGNSTSYLSSRDAIWAPDTMTLSAWVKTTTTKGGKIVGFGSFQNSGSTFYDRHLYLDNSGRPYFGVRAANSSFNTINSTTPINDGQWHNVVGQFSSAGMALYVDGLRVARRTDTTSGFSYIGFWHVGGDTLSGWNGAPASAYLSGSIANVAIFPSVLTSTQIQNEYTASGRSLASPAPPADAYGQAVYSDDPDMFWRLDETSGAVANDASPNLSTGAYFGNYALNQTSPVTSTGKAVYFPGSNTGIGSNKTFNDPLIYSEEAWFKTSTTQGGKILGFGNKQSGVSSNYDRHVYMLTGGQLVFGVYTGAKVTITSAKSYNDNKWHHVVATQGPAGMVLYVDGTAVGTDPNTVAQNYTGNWRVGGDATWSGAQYFNGTIDEVAFYSSQLSAARVVAHYKASGAGNNVPPVAAFTSSATNLDASFDGSGSSDPDGTIASYAWNFGDGATGTGAKPTHSYASGGTYNVTLTVTDNDGAVNATTKPITVTAPAPNQNPTASFTKSCVNTACDFDASASNDPDGTIASYAWDFGDGTTGTGVTPSHTYATGGTYTVTLTVTDNQGGTGSNTGSVTVNQPPVAAFTFSNTNLNASFDGTGSSDPDGTIASYAWDFGDNTTGTGSTANHSYALAGTYTVKLTVTDNNNATNSVTHQVTVGAANQDPTAAFTWTVNNLSVSFDGTGSTDADGSIASYAWDFGDGGTATGATPTHPYAAAGAYIVTLTVTDNQGATNAVSHSVITTAPTAIAADAFGRTVSNGWGTADTGGSWTLSGSGSLFSVGSGTGKVKIAAVSTGPGAFLNSVSARDVNELVDFTFDSVPTGGGTYAYLLARHVGTTDYRLKAKVLPTSVTLYLTKVVAGTETTILSKTITMAYNLGDVLRMRFVATGTGTTSLSGKIWKVGTTEPATAQVTATDGEATLQGAGGVGLLTYLSGSSTTVPVVVSFDNLTVAAG